MTTAHKRIIRQAADTLNEKLDEDPNVLGLLEYKDGAHSVLELINGLLGGITDGGRLIVARETDGSIVGFVPKSDIVTERSGE